MEHKTLVISSCFFLITDLTFRGFLVIQPQGWPVPRLKFFSYLQQITSATDSIFIVCLLLDRDSHSIQCFFSNLSHDSSRPSWLGLWGMTENVYHIRASIPRWFIFHYRFSSHSPSDFSASCRRWSLIPSYKTSSSPSCKCTV